MKPRRNVLPRRRRGLTASLAALAVLALAVLGTIAAIQIHYGLDRTALGKVSYVSHRLRTRDWTDVGVLVAGIVLGVIGLWFLFAGLIPARRSLIKLEDVDAGTIMGITKPGLLRDLTAVALTVDGVDKVSVRVKLFRRIRVRAASELRDVSGVNDSLEAALNERVSVLAPVRAYSVRARVAAAPEPKRHDA